MGYTHYWRRLPELDAKAFEAATKDIRTVLAMIGTMGVKLAGPHGTGPTEVTATHVGFNGVENCGHTERELGIAWPAPNAGGVGTGTKGSWPGGKLLTERTCGGDCSHESFIIEQTWQQKDWSNCKDGKFFDFCKTAYKPYDLAVTAALIILKHHLKDAIKVSSDGVDTDWRDGAMICQMVLGYGATFKLDRGE